MNILFVAPDPPFPPTDGARLVVAHLARELARTNTLFLAALTDDNVPAPENGKYFAATRFARRTVVSKSQKWVNSVFDELPLWARVNVSPALRDAIHAMLAEHAIDVVHLDTGLMATYLDAVTPVPAVLAPHDSLTRVLEHRMTHSGGIVSRVAARLQYGKMKRFETIEYARAARVVVVTEREQEYLRTLSPALALRVIPNGIDTDSFVSMPGREAPFHIGFHGVVDYDENASAVLHFARDILPLVWNELPDTTFTIIGRNPGPHVRALAEDKRIRVTGTVEDVRPWIAAQALMVVPMLEAGGIKNKMLEAMAMGKAVVASPQATEGISARAEAEFVLAQSPSEWAVVCVRLLRDNAERNRLGTNARAWALQHTWQKTASAYAAVYREAIDAAALR